MGTPAALWRSQPLDTGQTSGAERTRLTGLCLGVGPPSRWKMAPGPDPGSLVSLVPPGGGQGSELGGVARRRHPFCPVSHLAWGQAQFPAVPPTHTDLISVSERTQPGAKCELKCASLFLVPSWPPPPPVPPELWQLAGPWLLLGWGAVGGCVAPFSQEWKQRSPQRESQVPHTFIFPTWRGARDPGNGGLPPPPRPFTSTGGWQCLYSLVTLLDQLCSCPREEAGSRGRRSWREQPRGGDGERHRRSASCSDWEQRHGQRLSTAAGHTGRRRAGAQHVLQEEAMPAVHLVTGAAW